MIVTNTLMGHLQQNCITSSVLLQLKHILIYILENESAFFLNNNSLTHVASL